MTFAARGGLCCDIPTTRGREEHMPAKGAAPSNSLLQTPSRAGTRAVAESNRLLQAPEVISTVSMDDARALALTLPRSSEAIVRGRLKFRIGRIVYLAFSHDGSVMGFAFPKEWRDALVEAEPEKFSLPSQSDLRYHWVHVNLAAIDANELRELVEDAWAFVVPKRVAEEYIAARGRAHVA
jgi:hypothetical protein